MDCKPNMKIANPPRNSITLEYLMATFVPKVPRANHPITAVNVRAPNITGSTPPTAPCEDNTKFSMLPKINNPKYSL